MIGKLTWLGINGMILTATLEDDLKWSSERDMITIALNFQYPPDSSPANGSPGYKQLYNAAARLKAKVELGPTKELPRTDGGEIIW